MAAFVTTIAKPKNAKQANKRLVVVEKPKRTKSAPYRKRNKPRVGSPMKASARAWVVFEQSLSNAVAQEAISSPLKLEAAC